MRIQIAVSSDNVDKSLFSRRVQRVVDNIPEMFANQAKAEETFKSLIRDALRQLNDDFKRDRMRLRPVMRNYADGVPVTEALYYILSMPEDEDAKIVEIARAYATENRNQILRSLEDALHRMREIEHVNKDMIDANEVPIKHTLHRYTRFGSVVRSLQDQLAWFGKTDMISTASAQVDPRQYQWLEYQGRKARIEAIGQDKREYNVALQKGDKFGIKQFRGKIYMVDASDLSLKLAMTPEDAKRLIDNSVGYDGKIGRYRVRPAEGGKDSDTVRASRRDAEGRLILRMDSSMFLRGAHDSKSNVLYVQFKSGATWAYKDVTEKEAKALERAASQGKWFNRNIKGIKDEERVEFLDAPV